MSTIASPRPSIALSSRRTSTSTDTTARSPSTSRAPPPATQRRNRAALREFYGLKNAEPAESAGSKDKLPLEDKVPESELDKAEFNAEQYVKDVLAKDGLEGVLRAEASLVSEIRGFDGERKALVYDNYSKLIGATDTIRKMRTNMDPLTPTTSTLAPAIAHIADTAAALSASLRQSASSASQTVDTEKYGQQKTVQWVLDAPTRLRRLCDEERQEEAHQDWARVSALLNRWKGVDGVEAVQKQCETIMADLEAP